MLSTFYNRKHEVKPEVANLAIAPVSALENNAGMDPAWLKREIERRDLLQREVADAIGLSESQMTKVLKGERQLKGLEVIRALKFFGYPVPADFGQDDPLHIIVRYASRLDREKRHALAEFLDRSADD